MLAIVAEDDIPLATPEMVRPIQLIVAPTWRKCPTARLWFAMVEEALRCLLLPADHPLYRDAWRWFMGGRSAVPFECIAELFGWPLDKWRAYLQAHYAEPAVVTRYLRAVSSR